MNKPCSTLTLAAIQEQLGGTLHPPRQSNDGGVAAAESPERLAQHVGVKRLQTLERATAEDCSFLSNPRYRQQLAQTEAGCVIVSAAALDAVPAHAWAIVVLQPYMYYARLSQLFRRRNAQPQFGAGVHPAAYVAPTASIHPSAHIAALAVVEEGASVGAHSVVRSHAVIGHGCTVGAHCLIHSGAVIGADGFGFAHDGDSGQWVKIEQLGNVRIGDYVEVGASTCIDRGALSDTVIESGVKLDNLIQIAHNVRVGAHTAIAACVGIAGSADIGQHCTIGGGAIVLGHLSVANNTHISAASVVSRSLLQAGNYSGFFPIDENSSWERNAAALKQLYQMRRRLKRLENSKL